MDCVASNPPDKTILNSFLRVQVPRHSNHRQIKSGGYRSIGFCAHRGARVTSSGDPGTAGARFRH